MERPLPSDASASVAPDQLSTELGDDVVILGLRDSVYYGLTGVGTRIWQLLQTPRPISEIADLLANEYDVSPETARGDLERLLIDLEARGLVSLTVPERP